MSEKIALLFEGAIAKDRLGSGEEALQILETLLQYQPDHRLALFYRGGIKIRYRDDYQAAIRDWELAFVGAAPGSAARVQEIYPRLVEICLQRFAHCTTLDANDPAPHAIYGRACQLFGLHEPAERHLRRALDLDGTRWQDGLLLHQLYSELGQEEQAFQCLQKLLDKNPEVAEVHFAMGAHHSHKKSLAFALRHLETAIGLDPNHRPSRQLLAEIYLLQGRFENAETQLGILHKASPNASVHLGLAECAKQQYRFEEALHHCRQAVQLEPHNFRALSDFGALALQFGDLDLGIAILGRALETEPNHPEIYAQLAKAAQQKGDSLEAIRHLRQLLKLDPNDGFACYNLASQLRSLGDFRESSELLQKALTSRPGDVQIAIELADCYVQLNRRQEAIDLLRAAFERNPNHQDLREALGRLAPATSAPKAVSRGPNLEELVNLGRAHLQAGRSEEALESYRAAHALSPRHPECLLQLARLYAARELIEPAADLLVERFALDSSEINLLPELFEWLQEIHFYQSREVLEAVAAVLLKEEQKREHTDPPAWLLYLWERKSNAAVNQHLPIFMDIAIKAFPAEYGLAQHYQVLQDALKAARAAELQETK